MKLIKVFVLLFCISNLYAYDIQGYLFKYDGTLNKIALKDNFEYIGTKLDDTVNKTDNQTVGGNKIYSGSSTFNSLATFNGGVTATDSIVTNSTMTNLTVTNLNVTGNSAGIWKVIYYAVNLSSTTTYTISGLDSSQVKQYRIRFNYHQGASAAECKFIMNGRASGEYALGATMNAAGTLAPKTQNDTNFFEVSYAYQWCQGEILIFPRSKYTKTLNFPSITFNSSSSTNDGLYPYYTYQGGGILQVNEDITSVAFTGAANTVGYGSEFTVEELR
jgi:hypothetical protein